MCVVGVGIEGEPNQDSQQVPEKCLCFSINLVYPLSHGSCLSGYKTYFSFGRDFPLMWRVFQSTSAFSQSNILIKGFKFTNLAVQNLIDLRDKKYHLIFFMQSMVKINQCV